MKPSDSCYDLIRQFEGFVPKAYPDPGSELADLCRKSKIRIWDYEKIPNWQQYKAAPWTIGYGSTFYAGGAKVKPGDTITKDVAFDLMKKVVDDFSVGVDGVLKATVNQNQFDSLVSFTYNVGLAAFRKSTLLSKVNKNPSDPSIEAEFMKWVKSNGKVMLTKRRQIEADLYFKK